MEMIFKQTLFYKVVVSSISRYANTMKRASLWVGVGLVVLAGLAWSSRGFWREEIAELRQPSLPPAVAFPAPATPPTPDLFPPTPSSTPPTQCQKGFCVPTSTPPTQAAPTTTPLTPPIQPSATLPTEVNLAVPFLSQAPKQNWDLPYQEACEEASLIMADAYLAGKKTKFTPEEGDRAILDLVAFEEREGYAIDVTAKEAAEIASKYFSKRKARVIVRPTMDEVRRLLAAGFPLIVPADGKALKNPNFRNGGPPYHMLILKGYLADGRWITNDPGTRKGADYIYDRDILWNAISDWNGGDVKNGIPSIVVMEPTA